MLMNRLWKGLCVLSLGSAIINSAVAQESAPPADEMKESSNPTFEFSEDREVETHHTAVIGSQEIAYTARAANLVIRDETGKAKASIFHIVYTMDGVTDPAMRPVTFAFNGGPGSSSVWLHLGAFGPRRVLMDDEGMPLPPPYRLVDNEYSLLDVTDLVFIDPVTTGYSRPAPGEDDGQFHGVNEDIESVGEFIRLWTSRNERWASPKFLAGESYGTTRAAGLSGHLQDRHGMFLNGIVLVSAVLNFQTIDANTGNDLPYPLFLPSFTATAWHHGKLSGSLQEGTLESAVKASEAFAIGEYASALMKGDLLTAEERSHVAIEVARFTGLSVEFVLECNLRVSEGRFFKELLRDRRRTTGRLDSRFTGIDADAAGESFSYDPSYAAIQGPYTACLNDYVRRELQYTNDLPYEILTGRVWPWSYRNAQNQYLNVAETLRGAMTENQALKVFLASGWFDLATPHFAADYTISHMGLEGDLRANVDVRYYPAGHMMYIQKSSLARLKDDLRSFYAKAAPQR